MEIFATILHVIIALALVLIVLLQTGKGSDLASAFGGGGQNAVFGGAGPASFLNKMTTAVAVLFMATSITLAYISSGTDTIMQDQAPTEEAAAATTTDEQPVDVDAKAVPDVAPETENADTAEGSDVPAPETSESETE